MKGTLQSSGLAGDGQIVIITQDDSPTLSFTHGFIIGQLSVIIILVLFIRFFIFADVSSSTSVTTSSCPIPGPTVDGAAAASSSESPNSPRVSAYSIGGNITRAGRGLYAMIPSINPAMNAAAARIPSLLGGNAAAAAADGDDFSRLGIPTAAGNTHTTRPSPSPEIILNKTGYNVENHPAETLDWFNVLFAQTIARAREEALSNENIMRWLDSTLNSQQVPDFIDRVNITQLNLGKEFPKFSNCQIGYSKDESQSLEATMDVILNDTITLGIDTKLLLNYPLPMMAILPVSLVVSIVRFRGKLTISFKPTTQEEPKKSTTGDNNDDDDDESSSSQQQEEEQGQHDKTRTAFTFSFAPDYDLDFTISSLIGSRSRLQDIPKVAQIFESRIRKWFNERCVEPRFQQVILPSIWPRSKNTRQQQQTSNTPIIGLSPAIHPTTNISSSSRVASRQPSSGSLASGFTGASGAAAAGDIDQPPAVSSATTASPPKRPQPKQQHVDTNTDNNNQQQPPLRAPVPATAQTSHNHHHHHHPMHVTDFFDMPSTNNRPSSSSPTENGYFRARRPYG